MPEVKSDAGSTGRGSGPRKSPQRGKPIALRKQASSEQPCRTWQLRAARATGGKAVANRCPIRLGPARGRGLSAASMSLSGKRVHVRGPWQARVTSLGRVSSISQDSEIASMQGLGPSHRCQRSFERQSSAPTGRDIGSKTSWVCGRMKASWPDNVS